MSLFFFICFLVAAYGLATDSVRHPEIVTLYAVAMILGWAISLYVKHKDEF